MHPTLLIIDDEPELLESLSRLFKKEGYDYLTATSGEEGLDIIRAHNPSLVLTDLMMPGMSGIELMKAARTIGFDADFILMTAYGTVETAVEAMKEGAYDFITKPYKKATLIRTVERALEKQSLVAENKRLRNEIDRLHHGGGSSILGSSPAMRACLKIVEQAAPSSATVLLLGDSGTGKELFATELQRRSPRANKPFVAINCAALPETILEAELFGYEKGAFTGAVAQRKGRFEAANGGTMFLDEIADMSPALQAKLLRVLENGTFERLGSNKTISVDVRIIAATNRDLKTMVEEGSFREDLFYRLNVIMIRIPPLRDRREDIPILATTFCSKYAERHNKSVESISHETIRLLAAQNWPGNVRELEKTIERAVVLSDHAELNESDFPELSMPVDGGESSVISNGDYLKIPFGAPMVEVEDQIIAETLKRSGGDKQMTANILGISVRTIYRRLEDTGK